MQEEAERVKLRFPGRIIVLPTGPESPERPFVQTRLCFFRLSQFPRVFRLISPSHNTTVTMSETFQELADIPKDFVREGSLFIRRCTKRTSISP